ncbi:MAG: M42 family metallopeptidase [Ruminococcaceae bacterium]|nr:M42 family metallopeptidase [Oscillospiraceae bacterium]
MKTAIDSVSLIREMCGLFGPSGCEGEVADRIEQRIRPFCDSVVRDRMGNVLALIRTGSNRTDDRCRIMLSAHMDEVGVMLTELCEDGLFRFDTVGGISPAVLEGRKVTLGDEINRLSGVIASKAIHHKKKSERNKPTPIEQMVIDIGAESKEEAERYLSIGSFGTFDSECYLFGEEDGFIKAKALDDRMGCAALIEIMRSVFENRPTADLDLYFCFTVREEIGLSGAKVAAEKIAPDYAIVLETTAVADLPETPVGRRVASLGKGGVLSVMDRSTIYDHEFFMKARQIAETNGIPTQVKQYVSGGNDAGSIHKTGVGVRCLALSVPTRYLHSPSCVASLSDYRAVRELTEVLIRTCPLWCTDEMKKEKTV